MIPIATALNTELKWTQPSAFRQEFELRSGSEIAATLRFRSSFGSFATGESEDGCWTFKRVGFWQPRVTVRLCDSETDLATFANRTWSGGGTLTLPDGRSYPATTNLWQSKLEFHDESGAALFVLRSGGLLHLSAAVEVEPHAASMPELPWMLMLAWYILVMMQRDSSSGAAAAAAG